MAKIMIIQNGKKFTDADDTNPLQLKTILILVEPFTPLIGWVSGPSGVYRFWKALDWRMTRTVSRRCGFLTIFGAYVEIHVLGDGKWAK